MTTISDDQDINVGGITIHWRYGRTVLEFHERGDEMPDALSFTPEESVKEVHAWVRRRGTLFLSTDLEHHCKLYDEFMRCTDRVERAIQCVRSHGLALKPEAAHCIIGWDFPRDCPVVTLPFP